MDWNALALALFTAVGGAIAWVIRGRVDEWRAIREQLRSERRERYRQVLNPYVLVVSGTEAIDAAKVARSAEYRTEVFDLVMVAEDDVIRAYNEMMDKFVVMEAADPEKKDTATRTAFRQFGTVLLEIRRSLGNRKTDLSEVDILRAIGFKDAKSFLAPGELKKRRLGPRHFVRRGGD